MKSRIRLSFVGAMLMAPNAMPHHNFAAHYRTDETIEVSGVVTEFRFVNPHARLYFDVTTPDGTVETWMAEGDASVALKRSGWTADRLRPGHRITVVGNPSRFGSNMLGWDTITLADGTAIGGGSGRLDERLSILEADLAAFRSRRGP